MSTDFSTIRLDRSLDTCFVTLHRPDIRNAFNDEMIRELREAFAIIAADDGFRSVVLTGAGKSFCAGADLHWMRRMLAYTYDQNYQDSLELALLMRDIYECPKPVIGRINGPAIGGGTGLTAVCDIVVAVSTAVFSFSEVKIGLVPACISPYVLKRVRESHAREYFLTGERLTAERARDIGLVNRVVEAADLDVIVRQYTESVRAGGPNALATCKEMVRAVSDISLDDAGPYTAAMIARLRTSPEGQEGMSAFLERRRPAWWPAQEEVSWTAGAGAVASGNMTPVVDEEPTNLDDQGT